MQTLFYFPHANGNRSKMLCLPINVHLLLDVVVYCISGLSAVCVANQEALCGLHVRDSGSEGTCV